MNNRADATTATETPEARETPLERANLQDGRHLQPGPLIAGLLTVLAGGVLTRILTENVPVWSEGTPLESLGGAIEYPVYAIAIGLLLNLVLGKAGVRHRWSSGFRTEFFIKTGLVILGGTVVLSVIARTAGPAVIQALLLITGVFLFTWWVGGALGLGRELRALLASATSICGVSAAIAAAGAVRARKEELAYTAGLVILFALPSIFLLPWLGDVFGLSDRVLGAWIGGNIDTTAAVSAAGAVAGEEPLQIASIVKMTQNALIGFVAVGLTAYFAYSTTARAQAGEISDAADSRAGAAGAASGAGAASADAAGAASANASGTRPSLREFWQRFPKFVLGFLAASAIVTVAAEFVPEAHMESVQAVVKGFRDYFLILAFVSIGLEFDLRSLRQAGPRPIAVFALATLFNLGLGLLLAWVLFSGWLF